MHSLILLNGGVGARVGANQPKQFLKVNGIPILVYSLTAIDPIEQIGEIVMNYPDGWRGAVEKLLEDYAIKTPVTLVEAGDSRHTSVSAMLPHCTHDSVIIHEAARPLVLRQDFENLISSPHDNVALMHQIPFTVAPVDPDTHTVTGSLDRSRLRNVQLPQKFRTSDLADAHRQAAERGDVFTEDATLVATSGYPVSYIDGRDENFKVTTPTDIRLATYLMQENETSYE
ncbi:IspD/TarI family cytidylyltransferase [Microbacterium sp.]|uniref:IspD/TarI family cytidylyltransferase n=1 Tax=Microbacterium sp. TaxID=51671 RepID=UPI0039E28A9F